MEPIVRRRRRPLRLHLAYHHEGSQTKGKVLPQNGKSTEAQGDNQW